MVYFGISRILWTKITIQESGNKFLLSAHHPLRKAIDMDIHKLRMCSFKDAKTWSVSQHFVRVSDTRVWVYMHSQHIMCSNATLKNFTACIKMTVDDNAESSVYCPQVAHSVLDPFFMDNKMLKKVWAGNDTVHSYLQELDAYDPKKSIDEGMFTTSITAEDSGLLWHENIWSKRLAACLCLHLPGLHIKFTGDEGNSNSFRNVQSRKSGLSADEDVVKCYLFHGFTDITMDNICVQFDSDNDENNTINESSSEEDVEKKMEITIASEKHEIFPSKLGELIANLHISAVQRTTTMLMSGLVLKTLLVNTGMFITMLGVPFIVKLKMPICEVTSSSPVPDALAEIIVTESYRCSLNSSVLCNSLKQLVGSTKCNQTE